MIEVEAPNGDIVEFPDGTSDEVISKVMRQTYSPRPQQAQPPTQKKPFSILPLSEDERGNISFDSDAGILGGIKRAVTLPGDVFTGKVDPNSPEITERVVDFATTASPVGTAARVGERAIPGALKAMRPAEVKAPSAEALKGASRAGYDQARKMGVDYSSDAVKTLADQTKLALEADGVFAELSPKTFSIISKLQQPPEGSVASLDGLIAARRALNNAAADFANPTEQMAAKRAIEQLDQFLLGPDPSSVVAGPAAAASRTLKDAQGNYAAAKRSEKITGAQDRAELNAAVANSGQNIDNQIRQRMRDIVAKPKEARGYSEEELAAIQRVARGTPATNTARFVGNLLGGGGGLGAVASGAVGGMSGASFGGPVGAAIGAATPLAGYGSKKLAAALVNRQVDNLDDMVRQRSPLHQQLLNDAPMEVISPEKRAALVRMLMLTEPQTE